MGVVKPIRKPQPIFIDSTLAEIKSLLAQLDLFDSACEIIEATAQLLNVDLEKPVDNITLSKLRNELLSFETGEISSTSPGFHADIYTAQVFRRIPPPKIGMTNYSLLHALASLYQQIAPQLAPLSMKFMETVLRMCEQSEYGIKRILVLATDANILYVVGGIVAKQQGFGGRLELIELNRSILGIKNEFVVGAKDSDRDEFEKIPEIVRHSRSYDYLVSLLSGGPVALVDVGVYGTLVYILRYLGWRPLVFFLVSKNPYIHGYIDTVNKVREIDELGGIPRSLGGRYADAIEALPRAYAHVRLHTDRNMLKLTSKEIPWFCSAAGILACWAAANYATDRNVNTINKLDEIRNLAYLSRHAGFLDSLPFLMESQTPKWSHAEWFIRFWERKGLGYVEPLIGADPT